MNKDPFIVVLYSVFLRQSIRLGIRVNKDPFIMVLYSVFLRQSIRLWDKGE